MDLISSISIARQDEELYVNTNKNVIHNRSFSYILLRSTYFRGRSITQLQIRLSQPQV